MNLYTKFAFAGKIFKILICLVMLSRLTFGQSAELSSAPQVETFTSDPDITGILSNSVNLFTGDVALPVTLVSLPGKAGLTGSVSIAYNSNIQNQVRTRNQESPTGVLGLGWSLGREKIVRDHKGTGTRHDDEFFLSGGGTTTPLIKSGTEGSAWVYYAKGDPLTKVLYYKDNSNGDNGYWEILPGNGVCKVYGGTTNSQEYLVRIGNFFGSSNQTTNHTQFTVAWNISKVKDAFGNQVTYTYLKDNGTIGGSSYTRATYLQEITGVYGHKVTLFYASKGVEDAPGPNGAIEVYDPHIESSENDAYQEKYETQYLDYIEVTNASSTLMKTIDFTYRLETFESGEPDMYKRYLESITESTADGESLPPLEFEYYLSTSDTHYGALEKTTYLSGGTAVYTYTENIVESLSNFSKSIQSPQNGNTPQVYMANNYIVISWYMESSGVNIYAYTWEGKWKEQLVLSLPTSSNISLDDYQDMIVKTAPNTFAIWIDGVYDSSSLTTDEEVHYYHRNMARGEWSPGWSREVNTYDFDLESLQVGEDYIVFLIDDLRQTWYATNLFYAYWNDEDWISSESQLSSADGWGIGSAINYFVLNDPSYTDHLKVYYLNEQGGMTNTNQQDIGIQLNDNDHYWWAGPNGISLMAEGSNDQLWALDVNYNLVSPTTPPNIVYVSPVYFHGNSIHLANKTEVSRNNQLVWPFYRYHGNSWHLYNYGQTSIYERSFSASYDYSIITYEDRNLLGGYEGDYAEFILYNPNTGSFESPPPLAQNSNHIEYKSNSAYEYFWIWSDDGSDFHMYTRGRDASWAASLIPSTYNLERLANGGDFFITQSHNETITVHSIVNGEYESALNTNLTGKIYDDDWDNDDDTKDDWVSLVSGDLYAVYNGSDLSTSTEITLYKHSTKLETDYPIDTLTVDDGYQTVTTGYAYFDGIFDPSVSITRYNKVTAEPEGNFGRIEHYFFNGDSLQYQSQYPADYGTETNITEYLNLYTGKEYRTKIIDASGQTVTDNISYFDTFREQVYERYFLRETKSKQVQGGLVKEHLNTYSSVNGLLTSTQTKDSHDRDLISFNKYWYEAYGDGFDGYLYTPIIQRTTGSDKIKNVSLDVGAWLPNETTTNFLSNIEQTANIYCKMTYIEGDNGINDPSQKAKIRVKNSAGYTVYESDEFGYQEEINGTFQVEADEQYTVDVAQSSGDWYLCNFSSDSEITLNKMARREVTTWKDWSGDNSNHWAPNKTYVWTGTDDGVFNFNNWSEGGEPASNSGWIKSSDILTRNTNGQVVEVADALGVVSTKQYNYTNELPNAVIQNATDAESFYDGFESGDFSGQVPTWGAGAQGNGSWEITNSTAHSGQYSVKYTKVDDEWAGVYMNSPYISVTPGEVFTITAWYKCEPGRYAYINWYDQTHGESHTKTKEGTGKWERIRHSFTTPAGCTQLKVYLYGHNGAADTPIYYDDVRVQPEPSQMTTVTYNPITWQQTSTADPNGIPTFTEYDPFQRPIATRDYDGAILSETRSYYSRQGNNGDFESTDPNYSQSISYADGAPRKKVVGHWRFERAGVDATENNYDGTINGASFTHGYLGEGLQFDGTNDYVAIHDLSYNQTAQIDALTVGAWVKTTVSGQGEHDNWAIVDFDRSEYYNLFIYGDTGEVGFSTATSGGIADMRGQTPVNDGKWHYVCVVFDASESIDKKIYVDGELDATQNSVPLDTGLGTGTTRYGFIGDGSEASSFDGSRNNQYFQGTIDEVQIYHRALTASEIRSISRPTISTTYTDGMGKTIQTHTREGTDDIVQRVEYNSVGKKEKVYHSKSYFNPDHQFFVPDPLPSKYELYAYESDPRLRVASLTHPDQTGRSYQYNPVQIQHDGQTIWTEKTTVTAENGVNTTTYHDLLGNKVRTVAADGSMNSTTDYFYEILGNLLKIKDPKDLVTEYWYDTRGNVVKATSPDKGTIYNVYDALGRKVYSATPVQRNSNEFTVYWYDALGRKVRVAVEDDQSFTWTGNDAPDPANISSYGTENSEKRIINVYDQDIIDIGTNYTQGRLARTTVYQDNNESQYRYDAHGNILTKKQIIDGQTGEAKFIHHTLNRQGQEVLLEYPSGRVIQKTYNALGQLEDVTIIE